MQITMLPDNRRLHLQHGPIDLIIEAWGSGAEVRQAYRQACEAFESVLPDLVEELPRLRQPVTTKTHAFKGQVANRMLTATRPYCADFITPMAAVAGAVADHILLAMLKGREIFRAYVNDGGDIALHLGPGESLMCAIAPKPMIPHLLGTIAVTHEMPVRGIATSGAATKGSGGRSFSFGIADSVTILAASAAEADAAATIVANAVDIPGRPGIQRVPASSMDPDTDLGDRLVTVAVPQLSRNEAEHALQNGALVAEELRNRNLVYAAVLCLSGAVRVCAPPHIPLLTSVEEELVAAD